MARVRGFGLADAARWRCAVVGLCMVLGTGAGAAQDDKVPTLHVYTDVVQVPTLVLEKDRKPLKPAVAEGKFYVSFDGGPKFKVSHARLEGDDPIALSILLDLRQPFPELIDHFGGAAAGMAPVWLTAKDRVSIYSAECEFVRSAMDAPADAAALAQGVDLVLQGWRARKELRQKWDCSTPWGLWDSMAAVVHAMQRERGRRVLLVVTDGVDRKSRTTWMQLQQLAASSGVAVFGLVQPGDLFASTHVGYPSNVNSFSSICESSGGLVLAATPQNLATQLKYLTSLLRGRYIVEFPRPFDTTGGMHAMTMSIADRPEAVLLPAGVTVPVDNPALAKDPTTVPVDRTNAPVLGKGKAMTPQ
jgi:hypothetical protein